MTNDPALSTTLDQIRIRHDVPALAGAVFTSDGIIAQAAVGIRKRGSDVPVTLEDLWHLGSDTKMMTAALAGTFVAEGKLSWDATIISFFPELADRVDPALREITVRQVLGHQAGLAENLDWRGFERSGASVTEQRRAALEQALAHPQYAPGTYHYANTDYVVIGAILEKITGQPWEQLVEQRVFRPLGMTSVGFGGTGTLGVIDQPWPHLATGVPAPFNGPQQDNPPVMGPAGTVHCTLDDWIKFLTDQLRGACGQPALLSPEIYQAMQTAQPNSKYGMGWIVVERPWAGGKALNHGGSNTMNHAVCWLAPGRKFGVAICCNQGGDEAFKACDEAVGALIKRGGF